MTFGCIASRLWLCTSSTLCVVQQNLEGGWHCWSWPLHIHKVISLVMKLMTGGYFTKCSQLWCLLLLLKLKQLKYQEMCSLLCWCFCCWLDAIHVLLAVATNPIYLLYKCRSQSCSAVALSDLIRYNFHTPAQLTCLYLAFHFVVMHLIDLVEWIELEMGHSWASILRVQFT